MSHPPIDLTPAATNPRYGAIPPLLGSANAEYAQTSWRDTGPDAGERRGGCETVTAPKETAAVAGFRKGAEQGLASAQYELGVAYCNGQGVPKDATQKAAWYRKAAE